MNMITELNQTEIDNISGGYNDKRYELLSAAGKSVTVKHGLFTTTYSGNLYVFDKQTHQLTQAPHVIWDNNLPSAHVITAVAHTVGIILFAIAAKIYMSTQGFHDSFCGGK
ncbi:hypothetical protein GAMM_10043 [Gammaproteobacteria bacterium]